MTTTASLRRALQDSKLLGDALAGDTWAAWRALLLAAMGEPLKPDELELFKKFTHRDNPPEQRVDELWCVIGRRGGKSKAISALACYLACLCDFRSKLSAGETGLVLIVAPDQRQASVILSYAA